MSAKDTIVQLLNILEKLLGTEGIDTLGSYEIIFNGVATGQLIPSISTRYPQNEDSVFYRILSNSGIECIVEPEPRTNIKGYAFGNIHSLRVWTVTLTQYNFNSTLTDSVEVLCRAPNVAIFQQPVIIPVVESSSGITPAKALIFITEGAFLKSL